MKSRFFVICVATSALVWNIFVNGCGSSSTSNAVQTATVSTSLSDPATCSAPEGPFAHVYVTITDVKINKSGTAADNDSSWIDLTPNLKNSPQQVDLLGIANNQCFLAMLGSSTQIQAGQYQQIRVILANNGTSVANNKCSAPTVNCVVLTSDPINSKPLLLSSEATTGIKIPSGQIAGGAFTVAAGETKDLNIDFNACASIVQQGGNYRLKPVLHAGEVSTTSTSITGQVVDSVTKNPISGGVTLVALEQKDSSGVDRVVMETKADSTGNFVFCPVPAGTYDVVAVAVDGLNVAYSPTVLSGIGPGQTAGKLPLVATSQANKAQATINGNVTTANGSGAAIAADVAISALEQLTIGGGNVQITVPLVPQMSSTLTVTTAAGSCPTNTDCAAYSIGVPAELPNIGTFSSSGTSFVQATGPASYLIGAQAFVPSSGGTADCSPSSITTSPVPVVAGMSASAATVSFSGCQ